MPEGSLIQRAESLTNDLYRNGEGENAMRDKGNRKRTINARDRGEAAFKRIIKKALLYFLILKHYVWSAVVAFQLISKQKYVVWQKTFLGVTRQLHSKNPFLFIL
jgi:hypothetical protein